MEGMTPPSSWDDPQQRPSHQQYPPPQYGPHPYSQSHPGQPHPDQPGQPAGPRGFHLTGRQILAIVLAVLALIFILQNTDTTGVRLIVPKVHVPLFVALLIAAALGSIVTFLLMWRRQRRRERTVSVRRG